jgi:hypothetical protein
MVLPRGFYYPGAQGQLGFAASSDPRYLDELAGASSIEISVDSVLFEDGELVGPDKFRLVENWEARRSAALDLVREVDAARVTGTVDSVLERWMNVSESELRGNLKARWGETLAVMIRNDASTTAKISALPQLPNVARSK